MIQSEVPGLNGRFIAWLAFFSPLQRMTGIAAGYHRHSCEGQTPAFGKHKLNGGWVRFSDVEIDLTKFRCRCKPTLTQLTTIRRPPMTV